MERLRDNRLQRRDILSNPLRAICPWDYRSDRRVGQGELQGCGFDVDAVGLGDALDVFDLGDDVRAGFLVLEVRAAGEDPEL
jgi:hypothetical protein